MQLPAEAVSAAAPIGVVRLTAEPVRPADPFTDAPVALCPADEAAPALALLARFRAAATGPGMIGT